MIRKSQNNSTEYEPGISKRAGGKKPRRTLFNWGRNGNKTVGGHEATSGDITLNDDSASTLEDSPVTGFDITASFRTDVGAVRAQNQDNGLVASCGDSALLVVADGMGGHKGGADASKIAVDTIAELLSCADTREVLDVGKAFPTIASRVREVAPEGGTTLVVSLVGNGKIETWHVGDSRAYLYRNGILKRITTDHSWVQGLVDAGRLSEEQAAVHPRRNVLTRAIGGRHDPSPEYSVMRLAPYDIVMLSSDGLHGVLTETEIRKILDSINYRNPKKYGQELERVSGALIALANRNGGPDNISVAISISVPH